MNEDVMKELEKGLCEALSTIAKKGAAMTPIELDNASKAVTLLSHIRSMDSGSSSRSYGMHHGYSGHSIKDRTISMIEKMMDSTNSEYERESLQNFIRILENER